MYALPRELEWQLLNLFAGWPRKGVPFKFDRYFPEHFTDHITLADYLAITADWPETNRRRDALIRKKVAPHDFSTRNIAELAQLQSLASLRVRLLAPLPLEELEQAHRLIVGNRRNERPLPFRVPDRSPRPAARSDGICRLRILSRLAPCVGGGQKLSRYRGQIEPPASLPSELFGSLLFSGSCL